MNFVEHHFCIVQDLPNHSLLLLLVCLQGLFHVPPVLDCQVKSGTLYNASILSQSRSLLFEWIASSHDRASRF